MSESTDTAVAQGVKQEQGTQPGINVVDTIPRSRLNEVITQKKDLEGQIAEMKSAIEEKQRTELEEQGKVVEVNTQLKSEIKDLKQYKKMFEEQDKTLRAEAMSKLSEDKQLKFKELKTSDLLNVVDELTSVKNNPPDNAGTVKNNMEGVDWTKMDDKDRRKNWSDIVSSFKR
jgi:TolA-binding protein